MASGHYWKGLASFIFHSHRQGLAFVVAVVAVVRGAGKGIEWGKPFDLAVKLRRGGVAVQ